MDTRGRDERGGGSIRSTRQSFNVDGKKSPNVRAVVYTCLLPPRKSNPIHRGGPLVSSQSRYIPTGGSASGNSNDENKINSLRSPGTAHTNPSSAPPVSDPPRPSSNSSSPSTQILSVNPGLATRPCPLYRATTPSSSGYENELSNLCSAPTLARNDAAPAGTFASPVSFTAVTQSSPSPSSSPHRPRVSLKTSGPCGPNAPR
eukprot:29263-Pelagococcus_subviridis.AAC.2